MSLPVIYRVIRTALVTIVVLAALVVGGSFLVDRLNRHGHEALRALVVSRYYDSAARGEVASPAFEPGAVQAVARCNLSPPFIVRVKTISGEKRTYFAEGHPHFNLEAESWIFRPRD